MKKILSRFLEYVTFDTQSSGSTGTHPSTAKQFELAQYLKNELAALGINDVTLTGKCYLYAKLPATPGLESVPALGFIAHMDTSDAASGADVKPQIIEKWDGSPIPLGTSGRVVTPAPRLKGDTIITTTEWLQTLTTRTDGTAQEEPPVPTVCSPAAQASEAASAAGAR